MQAVLYSAGSVIIKQGDVGREFFLIRKGSVDVAQTHGKTERVVATLKAGDFFGEVALLEDRPRNATVVAKNETLCYTLGKDEFRSVVSRSHTFEEELRKVLFARQ